VSERKVEIKTPELMIALASIHPPDKWAFFDELRIGGGYGHNSEQRFDGYAIHYYPSKQNVAVCYEIKASRSDFKSEINKPKKRRAGLRLSNEFYFVCPKDMVTIEEVPVECGLMEVDEKGVISTTIKAPFRNTIPPTFNFLATVCRRIDKPRLEMYNAMLDEDGKLKEYGEASIKVLKEHIYRWKSFNQGNKEVPDKIAEAMESAYIDIIDVIETNRSIK